MICRQADSQGIIKVILHDHWQEIISYYTDLLCTSKSGSLIVSRMIDEIVVVVDSSIKTLYDLLMS